jgi:hypothetical protein
MPKYRVCQTIPGTVACSQDIWAQDAEKAELLFGMEGAIPDVPISVEELERDPLLFDVFAYFGPAGPLFGEYIGWSMDKEEADREAIHQQSDIFKPVMQMTVEVHPCVFMYTPEGPVPVHRNSLTDGKHLEVIDGTLVVKDGPADE